MNWSVFEKLHVTHHTLLVVTVVYGYCPASTEAVKLDDAHDAELADPIEALRANEAVSENEADKLDEAQLALTV